MRLIAALFAVLIAALAGGFWLMSKQPWRYDGERPAWHKTAVDHLVGRHVLIGLTYLKPDGELDHRTEFHGRIVTADEERGFEVALEGARAGETYWLPPAPDQLQPAAPGTYRLKSTGEDVVDPDFISNWTVTKPATP